MGAGRNTVTTPHLVHFKTKIKWSLLLQLMVLLLHPWERWDTGAMVPTWGQLVAGWASRGPCSFWGSAHLPGPWWPLQACVPLVGGVGTVPAAAGPSLPPAPLLGLPGEPAKAGPDHATSSFKEQTKVPVLGRADSWGPGREESPPGRASCPHRIAHLRPGLWPGPVVGTGPVSPPFLPLASSRNRQGYRNPGVPGLGVPARAVFASRFQGCQNGQLSPCPAHRMGAAGEGAPEGDKGPPAPPQRSTARANHPLAQHGCAQWTNRMWSEGAGVQCLGVQWSHTQVQLP